LETTPKSASVKLLIDLLAFLGPELWIKNLVFDKNQIFTKGLICHFRRNFGQPLTWQQIELESSSNAVKTQEDLYFRMKKKLSFELVVFGWWRHEWGMFCLFLWRHHRSNKPVLWLKVLLDYRL